MDGPDLSARGGYVPGPGVEVSLAPDECVVRPTGDGNWYCVRNHVPRLEWRGFPHPNRSEA